MYQEFLQAVLAYVVGLDEAAKFLEGQETGNPMVTPYVNFVPVLLEGELCGFLEDGVGGLYYYRDPTQAELEWWEERPR